MSGFPRLFNQFITRALIREKLRAGLGIVGIALGVAVMVAIRLANFSVTDSFRAAVDAVGGDASLRVAGRAAPIDEQQLPSLDWLRQFGTVSPVLENYAMHVRRETHESPGRLGRGELLYVLGVDVLRDVPIRKYQLLQTDPEQREVTPRELLDLVLDDQAIILTEQFARRRNYRIGDTITLAFGSRQRQLHIRGLLLDEGPARTLNGNFALMDIAAAQLASDRFGVIDYLDIKLEEGADIDAARRAIDKRLPDVLAVEEPSGRAGRTETMIAAFQFNLTALSSVALLVGLLLIYNTVSVSVAARREEIGVLSAMGASRSTIAALFLGEAALLAVAGAALGVPLGRWLARGAVTATAQTVETFYIATVAEASAATTNLPLRDVATIVLVTLVLALIAAAVPALSAARTDPVRVIRGNVQVAGRRTAQTWLILIAALLALIGFALTRLPPLGGKPVFGFVAELLFMASAAVMTPLVLIIACQILKRGASRWVPFLSMESKLAGANLLSAIPQTSISVAALAMSLGMMIAIGVMVGSFRQTVIYWLDSVLTADLVVKPIMNNSALSTGVLDAEVAEQIRQDSDVLATCWYSSRPFIYGDQEIRLDTSDLEQLLTHGRVLFKEPRGAVEAVRSALREQREFVVVSESFALRFKKTPGDRVSLPTRAGTRELPILAVYYDYASNQGTVLLDYSLYEQLFHDRDVARAPMAMSMYLREGADADAVRERLAAAHSDNQSLYFVTNHRIRREAMRVFDSTFAITYALQAIAIVIAGSGVIATLTRLIYERQKELGLLSLVGATPRQLQRMIVIEAVTIGTVSQLVGIAVGMVLAIVLIYVINVQSFGWTIQFHWPTTFLLQSTLAIVLASALFGNYPARRAAGMDALDTVRES